MEKINVFIVFLKPQNFKSNKWKKHNLYSFSQNYKKWSVIDGKDSVVIDFN
jgi:hypothetical protein